MFGLNQNALWAVGGVAAGLVLAHYKKANMFLYGAIGAAAGFAVSNYIVNKTATVVIAPTPAQTK